MEDHVLEMLTRSVEEGALKIRKRFVLKNKEDGDSDTTGAKELETIYAKSLTRIFKIWDKLAAGPFTGESQLTRNTEESLPNEEQERKYFKIGDRVVIEGSYRDFKYVQKKMPAWKKSMRNLHGQRGIVTDQHSRKATNVQVYFPDIFSSCAISTAVLKKDDSLPPNDHKLRSRWKVGDNVQICAHKVVVKQLMTRLPDIPKKHIGKSGKVIAVTTAGVFVTFDGLRSYATDSALLQNSDQEPCMEITDKSNPKGFKLGEKVKVISHLGKLISNQKGKGGWNKEMCRMAGKRAFISDINNDDTIDVSSGFSRGWRMNSDSILKLDEPETHEEEKELDFSPGDKVKIRMTEDIWMNLISKNIPLVFLEYLKVIGEVNAIDDDLDTWTRLNSTARICIKASSLEKADENEAEQFEKVQKDLKSLKVGDKVYLDVGPPNYVGTVLAQYRADGDAIGKYLTSVSEVVGWVGIQHAVIQYSDGKKFRLNKEYLTTPERFNIQDAVAEEFEWKSVEEMKSAITDCMQKIYDEEHAPETSTKAPSVEVYSMLNGQPPTVEFRIQSPCMKVEKLIADIIANLKQTYGWKMEQNYFATYSVLGLRSFSQEVNVGFLFNENIYRSSMRSRSHGHKEPTSTPQRKSSQALKRKWDAEEIEPQKVKRLDEFRLVKLRDNSSSSSIYFPYIVRGSARENSAVGQEKDVTFNIAGNATVNIPGSKIGMINFQKCV